jgi:hypothetical protein
LSSKYKNEQKEFEEQMEMDKNNEDDDENVNININKLPNFSNYIDKFENVSEVGKYLMSAGYSFTNVSNEDIIASTVAKYQGDDKKDEKTAAISMLKMRVYSHSESDAKYREKWIRKAIEFFS